MPGGGELVTGQVDVDESPLVTELIQTTPAKLPLRQRYEAASGSTPGAPGS